MKPLRKEIVAEIVSATKAVTGEPGPQRTRATKLSQRYVDVANQAIAEKELHGLEILAATALLMRVTANLLSDHFESTGLTGTPEEVVAVMGVLATEIANAGGSEPDA